MAGIITKPILGTGFFDPASQGKPSFPGVLLTDSEVASRLGTSLAWLRANGETLQAMGFPEPLCDAGERWDAALVWDWQRAMASIGRSVVGPPATLGEQIDWEQELAGRHGKTPGRPLSRCCRAGRAEGTRLRMCGSRLLHHRTNQCVDIDRGRLARSRG